MLQPPPNKQDFNFISDIAAQQGFIQIRFSGA